MCTAARRAMIRVAILTKDHTLGHAMARAKVPVAGTIAIVAVAATHDVRRRTAQARATVLRRMPTPTPVRPSFVCREKFSRLKPKTKRRSDSPLKARNLFCAFLRRVIKAQVTTCAAKFALCTHLHRPPSSCRWYFILLRFFQDCATESGSSAEYPRATPLMRFGPSALEVPPRPSPLPVQGDLTSAHPACRSDSNHAPLETFASRRPSSHPISPMARQQKLHSSPKPAESR